MFTPSAVRAYWMGGASMGRSLVGVSERWARKLAVEDTGRSALVRVRDRHGRRSRYRRQGMPLYVLPSESRFVQASVPPAEFPFVSPSVPSFVMPMVTLSTITVARWMPPGTLTLCFPTESLG